MTRWRALAGMLAVLGTQAHAQSNERATVASFRFFAAHYGTWLVDALDSIPEAKYQFRPAPPQQSIGWIAQHVENANYGLCGRLGVLEHTTTGRDAIRDSVKATWPKDTLVARLRASLAYCDSSIARLTDADLEKHVPYGPPGAGMTALPSRVLVGFVTDLAEHYSQVAVYMRVLGLVPPSALPPRPRVAINLEPSKLAAYVGSYDLAYSEFQDAPPLVLDVALKDGALYVTPRGRPTVRLWPESAREFFVKEIDAQVTFMTDSVGRVSGLVLHQNGEDRVAPREGGAGR
jgi:uncharacterized damage-inducible protein DinB